jgi:hypothetical protein
MALPIPSMPSANEFFELAENIHVENQQSSDWFSYRHFVKWFEEHKSLTEQDFVVASYFAYGWMPKVLRFRVYNLKPALDAMNDVLKTNQIGKNHLELVKEALNNSYIGASKLLHFAKPNLIPIYDSNVAEFCFGETQGYNDSDWFYAYKKYIDQLKTDKRSEKLRKRLSSEVGFDITTYRALEYTMYAAD